MPELPDVVVYVEAPQRRIGGKLLTDRALSSLLGKDRPRTLEGLEQPS